MKSTVIRVSMPMEKDLLELYRKKLNEFLTTPIDGKIPEVKFIAQSEYTPAQAGGLRGFSALEPHITLTILWE